MSQDLHSKLSSTKRQRRGHSWMSSNCSSARVSHSFHSTTYRTPFSSVLPFVHSFYSISLLSFLHFFVCIFFILSNLLSFFPASTSAFFLTPWIVFVSSVLRSLQDLVARCYRLYTREQCTSRLLTFLHFLRNLQFFRVVVTKLLAWGVCSSLQINFWVSLLTWFTV